MAKDKEGLLKSRGDALRTGVAFVSMICAIVSICISTTVAVVVVLDIDIGLQEDINALSDAIEELKKESWHVLHDETVEDINGNSGKFYVPAEASRIRVIWGESWSYGDSGPGYLCWEDGRDATACYMNIPIPSDISTEISVDWLPQDRRLLFIDMGPLSSTSAKVHVDGYW